MGEPFQVVVANLGDAEVQGIDMDLKAVITKNFQIGFNMTYIDKAEVEAPSSYPDDRFPGGEATLGLEPTSDLPLFADQSWSGYAEYGWEMGMFGGSDIYIRLQHSYTGESYNQLFDASSSPRVLQEDYSQTDISMGLSTDSWMARIYVNNLDDERGVTYYDSSDFDPFFGRSSVNIIRPRNAGISFRYRF